MLAVFPSASDLGDLDHNGPNKNSARIAPRHMPKTNSVNVKSFMLALQPRLLPQMLPVLKD